MHANADSRSRDRYVGLVRTVLILAALATTAHAAPHGHVMRAPNGKIVWVGGDELQHAKDTGYVETEEPVPHVEAPRDWRWLYVTLACSGIALAVTLGMRAMRRER